MPRAAVVPKRPPLPGELVCGYCRWPKPRAEFADFERGREGKDAWCRTCHRDYDRRRHQRLRLVANARSARYAKAHPERKAAAAQLRRDLVAQSPTRLCAQQAADLLAYFGECCACGSDSRPLRLDHVIPLARGGADGPENRQACCDPCNRSKKDDATDFRPAWYRRRVKAGRDPGPPPYPWPTFEEAGTRS